MTRPVSLRLKNQSKNINLLFLVKTKKTNPVIYSVVYFIAKGFLQRNCTQDAYWSEPFPPYTIACGFDEGSSKGPEDQVSFWFPVYGHLQSTLF